MKIRKARLPLAALATIAMAAVLVSGIALRAHAQAASKDEVVNLQKKFQDASVSGDTPAIAALMADDAIFVHGNAAMQDKTQFLAAIKNGQLALSAYDLKDPKVVMFDGGAIVTGIVDIGFKGPAGGTGGPPRTLHMRGSSVWLQSPAGWKLILDQDTPIQGPPAIVPLSR